MTLLGPKIMAARGVGVLARRTGRADGSMARLELHEELPARGHAEPFWQ